MHVAITGVSGFIGAALAREANARGHTVAALVRATSRRDHIEAVVDRFVEGAQDDTAAWSSLLEDADGVIHNAFDWLPLRDGDLTAHLRSNVDASIRLLHESAPRRFVYMSSVAVHHDIRPRWGGQIDADHPARPASLYGAAKVAVEAHLFAAHFGEGRHAASIRPCAVYGIDPKLPRSIGYPIVEKLRAGDRFERTGGGKFVHVDDVAVASVAALENDDAAGGVFHLVDCYARWADWASIAAELLGVEADIEDSSPASPSNHFIADPAQALGARLDRGHDGIREHLRELITLM